jgi:glycosyltransferase involved in cell wall biosynthesis
VIFLDVTQAARSRHHSGLNRVSACLRAQGGADITPIVWSQWSRSVLPGDCFLTSELFSTEERPGLMEWLRTGSVRSVAIFHDAIPLRHPLITWGQSVGRHAAYVKLLAEFDEVMCVSADSARDLQALWRWQGLTPRARVRVLGLGADGLGGLRQCLPASPPSRSVVAVGIVEPRKNQMMLLEAAEALWRRGRLFRLTLVGRVNPQFGAPIVRRISQLRRAFPGLLVHETRADDVRLRALLADARCTAFPSLAEGCGLPVLESLWAARPCLCSDLDSIRESAVGGGCDLLPARDARGWEQALERLLFDEAQWWARTREAVARPLPCWSDTVAEVRRVCR